MRSVRDRTVVLLPGSVLALGLVALAWAVSSGPSAAQQDAMHNCPQPGKWAISVWSGDDDTAADTALTTCGEASVAAAYYIDPMTQTWSRWFAGQPDVSNLPALDDMQGVIAMGTGEGPITPSAVRIAFFSNGGEGEIYVMNADGSDQINLTNNPADDQQPAWSPDGTRIAFVSYRDGEGEVYVMNADGTGLTNLSNDPAGDHAPVWSPDGSRIAFVSRRDGNAEIYVVDADGTGATNLTNNPVWDYGPTWSPDGSHIAFVSDRDYEPPLMPDGHPHEIYVMKADGSGQTRLTIRAVMSEDPAWSPDGPQIAFVARMFGESKIYVMNADGTGQTRVLTSTCDVSHACGVGGPLSWSADGSRIAFTWYRDGNGEIYVMNADGTGLTNLTQNPAEDQEPTWSPDGSQIAFVSDRDGNDEIYVMNADGTGQTRLTNTPADDEMPAWSP